MSAIKSGSIRRGAIAAALVALQAAGVAWAQMPTGTGPNVKVTNTVFEPVPVVVMAPVTITPSSPGESFSHPPKQLSQVLAGAAVPPDPSGTRYAITSLTGVNPTAQSATVVTRAIAAAGTGSGDCTFVFNQEDTTDGPEIEVPANGTAHITFPQPFVTAAVTGTFVCLVAGGDGFIGVKWSATGYKILP